MSRRVAVRLAVAMALSCVPALVGVGAPASSAAAADDSGQIVISDGATATADAQVDLVVPAPTDSAGTLRLSDDGGNTWLERPWTTSLSWSLIDPAAGGVDADGTKTVTVEGGDDTLGWQPLGSASILLDRTGPQLLGEPTLTHPGTIWDFVRMPSADSGVGDVRTEVSYDDEHWRVIDPAPNYLFSHGLIDLRDGTIGGSWTAGDRVIYVRAVDGLGNATYADPIHDDVASVYDADDPAVTFEFPRPAVAGQPYTIKPVFGPDYRLTGNEYCQWELIWGDDAVRMTDAFPDPTYGRVRTSVPANADGACDPWTVTLPYTPPLEYTWSLGIMTSPRGGHPFFGGGLQGSFRAAPGDTTSRAITESSLPLVYELPDRDYVGADGDVTYHLYSLGGASTDGGVWGCGPSHDGPQYSQRGGDSFACPVNSDEPWDAYWDREQGRMNWFTDYDPIGDLKAPKVRSFRAVPVEKPGAGANFARLTWSGSDRGSGIHRWTLQRKIGDKPWATLRLGSRMATATTRSLAAGERYRYRVRATDRAGNVGRWAYSPTVRSADFDDGDHHVVLSDGWRRSSASHALGGHVRTASASGATARFGFTGSAVALLAPRTSSAGYVQVYVDGNLVDTVDQHSRSPRTSRAVWTESWAHSGHHVVRLRVLGTSGHPDVSIDGFAILH